MCKIKRTGGVNQAYKFVPLGGVFGIDPERIIGFDVPDGAGWLFLNIFVSDSNCGANVETGRLYFPSDDMMVTYYPHATLLVEGS